MDGRHHHVQIVFVGGSPKEGHPDQARALSASAPRTLDGPASPNSKADALRRLIENMRRQDEIAREFMRPDAAGFAAWMNRAT